MRTIRLGTRGNMMREPAIRSAARRETPREESC
jgi:hypothetical protein